MVSTTVVFVESVTLVVSVVLVDLVPLQAAKDSAMKAAKPSLVMVFIMLNRLIVVKLDVKFKVGNLILLILFNFFTINGLQFRINRINSE